MAPTDRYPRRPGDSNGPIADDELDVPLEDADQLEEVELLSSLMIEAGSAQERLGQHDIDRALGL